MKKWKYGVPILHSDKKLKEDLYMVFDDCRNAGCIIDIWMVDIQEIFKRHGYKMEIYLKNE